MATPIDTATEPLNPDRVNRLLLQYLDDGKEARSVLQEILVTLRKSSIVSRGDETKWVRFWNRYNQEADEYDREFLERYKEDMNTTMIFSGLFTAVGATIASMTVSGLSQDPNVVTQTILLNVVLLLNATSGSQPQGLPIPVWEGPSASIVWFQTLLYASLVCSLMAALGAVLAIQWLSRYKAVDERGTVEHRGMLRQKKFDGLRAWGFRTFLEALPILLQFSLLLFSVSICAYMWGQQRAIASVLIFANSIGGLLWVYTVVVSAIYPESPYDTPLSDLLASKKKVTEDTPSPSDGDSSSSTTGSNSPVSMTMSTSSSSSPSSSVLSGSSLATLSQSSERIMTSARGVYKFICGSPRRVHDTVLKWWKYARRTTEIDEEMVHSEALAGVSSMTSPALRERLFTTLRRVSDVTRRIPSRLTYPVRKYHEELLARSNPLANDVKLAAFLWLTETSTDPEIHMNAILVVPEIIWTEDKLTEAAFSLKNLDSILARIAAYFQEDGNPKVESIDTLVSLCAAFISIFWQLRSISLDATHHWAVRSGRPFANAHEKEMDILQAVDLKTFLYPAENTWILRHTFLTFMHFQSLSLSNEHPSQRIAFPDPAGLHSSSGNTLPTSSIALSRLRASSLVYLAQLSYADGWTVSDCITLFSQIEEYHVHGSGNNDASYFSVIATAMLLGFKINESSSLNSSTSEGWAEATEYILCEIQRQLQWRPSDDNRRPQIAQVFGYDENLVGDDALTMFSRIIHIVQFASQSLLVSRSVPPSGLTLFVATICRSSGVDRRTVYQAVTDSIQLLTPTAEDLITGNDGGFHAALNAVAKLKPISEDHPSHSSAFHAFIQMQHTALTLILSLAQSDTLRSTTRVPTFSPGSCPWDLSQPQSVVFPGTQLDELITERDTLFVDVLRKTPAGSKDISVRRACFDDPRNFGYVLQWIHIAHRWLVPPQDGLTHAMADSIGSDFLLDCAQFRQPDASVWGDNLVHVQQVLVAVLCRPWYLRLDIAGNGDEADFGDLIHSSLFVLPKMRAADAAAVEWYVRETVDSFQTCLARIRRKYGVVDPSLKAVLSAYKRKLLEIERWKRAEPSGDASSTSTSSGSTSQASEETSMSRQEAETESVVERERDEDAGDGGSQQLLQQRANVTRRGKESGGEGGSAVLGEDVFSDSEETETEATEDSSDGSVHGEGSSGGV